MSSCFLQVKVVELKVTWITKSYSPKGSDSVYPPASTITQENLCRSVQWLIHTCPLQLRLPLYTSCSCYHCLLGAVCIVYWYRWDFKLKSFSRLDLGWGVWATTTTPRGSWERGPSTYSRPKVMPHASPVMDLRVPLFCLKTPLPERCG